MRHASVLFHGFPAHLCILLILVILLILLIPITSISFLPFVFCFLFLFPFFALFCIISVFYAYVGAFCRCSPDRSLSSRPYRVIDNRVCVKIHTHIYVVIKEFRVLSTYRHAVKMAGKSVRRILKAAVLSFSGPSLVTTSKHAFEKAIRPASTIV